MRVADREAVRPPGRHRADTRTPPPPVPHAPGLDGLRALAVVAVLGYHLDLAWLGGGFLGVEVFFTLSGFLITQLLVAELGRSGRVDVAAFALARAKRLVPALVVCLAATVAAWRLLRPADAPDLRPDALAALFYAQNWHLLLAGVPYGEVFTRPSPLLHLWSLAVEGQLYVLWPVLFVGLLAARRRGWSALAALGLAGLSAALMALQYDPDTSGPAYYATDSRASGFLLGAAVALVWAPSLWSRRLVPAVRDLVDVAGLLAVVVLVVGFVRVSEFDDQLYRHGGFLRVGAVTAVVLVGATRRDTLVSRLLAGRVAVWVGRRSYGIYLYHWPIFVLTRTDADPPMLDLARLALTLVVAQVSYRWWEMPVRRARWLAGPRHRAVVPVAGGLVAAMVVGLVVGTSPTAATSPAPSPAASGAPLVDMPVPPDPAPTPWPTPSPAPSASSTPATDPPVGPVLVVGDSIALGAADALRAALGPGALVDAEVGRQFSAGVRIVAGWAATHPGPVVVDLGANGSVQPRDVAAVLDAAGGRRVVLVGTAAARRWKDSNNAVLGGAAARNPPEVVFVDWAAVVAGHPGAVGPDGVHPTPAGRRLLASAVAAALGR
jgi:peptidoglycan/LPS O-acetylase OafA/YrhL